MKKRYWQFLAGAGLFILAAALYFSPKINKRKSFDRFVSYTSKSYKPYDTRFFFEAIKKHALSIKQTATAPSSETLQGTGKLYIICSAYVITTESEKREIFKWVAAGNDVLISSFFIDESSISGLSDELYVNSQAKVPLYARNDSLSVVGNSGKSWSYPGSSATSNLALSAEEGITKTKVIMWDAFGNPSLAALPYGEGRIILQLEPMTFSNYFILHKNNYTYLEEVFKSLNLSQKSVIWDDYYTKFKSSEKRKSSNSDAPKGKSFFLEMLKRHPPLQWAVYTFIVGAILFLLNNARRLRDPVERLPDVKNESLEFTKAIAELYWQRRDHAVIFLKIKMQLQDHLYTVCKIFPKELTLENTDFISNKTGKSQAEVTEVINSILAERDHISDQSLLHFYRIVFNFIYK